MFGQVIEGQSQDLVGRNPRAVGIDYAESIRVAIGGQSQPDFSGAHQPGHPSQMRRARFRGMAAEERIGIIVEHG